MDDLEKIHNTSLDILANTGIKLCHDELLDHISNFDGVKINKNEKNVRFDANIITKSITSAGRKFKLYGRDKNKSADFGYDKIVTSSSWGMPFPSPASWWTPTAGGSPSVWGSPPRKTR